MPNWWDASWNPVAGCAPASSGCLNCYASRLAATQQTGKEIPIHLGTTDWKNRRPVFNGKLTQLAPGDPGWVWPLTWKGAKRPILGEGKPSLVFVCDMSDLFHEGRPVSIVRIVVETIAMSDHVGQLLTKRPDRMAEFFRSLPPETIEAWQRKFWLGFSAERQPEFDLRWPHMRELAARGWTVFASLAPLLGPIVLPDDFLRLGDRAWAICSGEVCPGARPMDPNWARAVRDQCARAGLPFFMLQMGPTQRTPIPPDLRVWQFPRHDGGG